MAASRSAAAPVRPNRARSAFPRLDRYMARSGWSVGVACTACCPASMAASRSPASPVRSNRARSAFPRLDRYMARSGWSAGVACTACWR